MKFGDSSGYEIDLKNAVETCKSRNLNLSLHEII